MDERSELVKVKERCFERVFNLEAEPSIATAERSELVCIEVDAFPMPYQTGSGAEPQVLTW